MHTEKATTNRPYRALWLAVIAQCLEDYEKGKLNGHYFSTKEFVLVCHLADVNPQNVLDSNSIDVAAHAATLKALVRL